MHQNPGFLFTAGGSYAPGKNNAHLFRKRRDVKTPVFFAFSGEGCWLFREMKLFFLFLFLDFSHEPMSFWQSLFPVFPGSSIPALKVIGGTLAFAPFQWSAQRNAWEVAGNYHPIGDPEPSGCLPRSLATGQGAGFFSDCCRGNS